MRRVVMVVVFAWAVTGLGRGQQLFPEVRAFVKVDAPVAAGKNADLVVVEGDPSRSSLASLPLVWGSVSGVSTEKVWRPVSLFFVPSASVASTGARYAVTSVFGPNSRKRIVDNVCFG